MGRQRPGNPLAHGQSEHTPLKQRLFRRILAQQASMVAGFQRERPWFALFQYMDLFAGPGYDDQDEPGSPLIARDVLESSGVRYRMLCCELNHDHAADLDYALDRTAKRASGVMIGDCAEIVPRWLEGLPAREAEHLHGVCYVDPNGDVPWDLLATIATALPKVDILIHLSATLVKRQRECSRISRSAYLADHVASIAKRHWLTTDLDGPHHWELLFGSNWANQPGIAGCGFVPLESERGKAIFRRANHTKEELAALPIEGQLTLFGGA